MARHVSFQLTKTTLVALVIAAAIALVPSAATGAAIAAEGSVAVLCAHRADYDVAAGAREPAWEATPDTTVVPWAARVDCEIPARGDRPSASASAQLMPIPYVVVCYIIALGLALPAIAVSAALPWNPPSPGRPARLSRR